MRPRAQQGLPASWADPRPILPLIELPFRLLQAQPLQRTSRQRARIPQRERPARSTPTGKLRAKRPAAGWPLLPALRNPEAKARRLKAIRAPQRATKLPTAPARRQRRPCLRQAQPQRFPQPTTKTTTQPTTTTPAPTARSSSTAAPAFPTWSTAQATRSSRTGVPSSPMRTAR